MIDAEWRTIGADYGFASVTGCVSLCFRGANADAPASLVAKLPTPDRWEQGAREVRFYREVGAVPGPAVYFADADHDRRRAVLLLEDLTAGRQGDALEGCSVDDAARVLEAIAPFHAGHWHARSAAPWLLRDGPDAQARQARFDERVERLVALSPSIFPDDVLTLVERLRSHLAKVIVRLDGGAQTVVHGDLHLDNLLFDTGLERPVAILDWQTACVDNPAWDIVLLVFGSLDVEDRRAAETTLLDEYVARLTSHGIRGYDRDLLLRDCRLALLVWLNGVIGWLVGPEPDRERMRTLRDAAVSDGRLVAALRDHDVASLLES